MTKKILFCTEASWYATGYSVYTKEVLSRLCQMDDWGLSDRSYCDYGTTSYYHDLLKIKENDRNT